MHHHRPSIGWRGGFDPPDEGQQASGVVGHAVLRPGGEVELSHLMFGRVAPLWEEQITNMSDTGNKNTSQITHD